MDIPSTYGGSVTEPKLQAISDMERYKFANVHQGMTLRTRYFSVFIEGDPICLVRWDRIGAVVTSSYSYMELSWFVACFKRYEKMLQFLRGRDQTVPSDILKGANLARHVLMHQHFSDGSNEERLWDAISSKFLVPALLMCPKTDVARPKSHTSAFPRRLTWSLLGRNSCGTHAHDRESEQIQWLKNCWRKDMKMSVVEHSSYKKTEQHKVQDLILLSVANEVHVRDKTYEGSSSAVHIDLRSSRGVSSSALALSVKRAEQLLIHGPVHKMEHCIASDRLIVLREVGRDLTSFLSTAVLLRAVADALLCHSDAQFKAAILHRDICPRNIFIMGDGTGGLIDWDLCRHTKQSQSRRPVRTCTWQFISGALLKDRGTKDHDYVDDLESFLHTLTFTLIRFSGSSLHDENLTYFLERFNDEKKYSDGKTRGGSAKWNKLAAGAYVEDLDFPGRPGLHGLLLEFADLFLPIYTPDRHQTEATRAQGEMLKTAEGGGLKIRGMILKFLKEVECLKDWPLDDRAKKVELPLSRSWGGKRHCELVHRVRAQLFS